MHHRPRYGDSRSGPSLLGVLNPVQIYTYIYTYIPCLISAFHVSFAVVSISLIGVIIPKFEKPTISPYVSPHLATKYP